MVGKNLAVDGQILIQVLMTKDHRKKKTDIFKKDSQI